MPDVRTPETADAHDLLVDADTRLSTHNLTRDTWDTWDIWDTYRVLTPLGLMSPTAGEVSATLTVAAQAASAASPIGATLPINHSTKTRTRQCSRPPLRGECATP